MFAIWITSSTSRVRIAAFESARPRQEGQDRHAAEGSTQEGDPAQAGRHSNMQGCEEEHEVAQTRGGSEQRAERRFPRNDGLPYWPARLSLLDLLKQIPPRLSPF